MLCWWPLVALRVRCAELAVHCALNRLAESTEIQRLGLNLDRSGKKRSMRRRQKG